jgi:hypothetical protein
VRSFATLAAIRRAHARLYKQQSRRSVETDGFAFSPYDVGLGDTSSGVSTVKKNDLTIK